MSEIWMQSRTVCVSKAVSLIRRCTGRKFARREWTPFITIVNVITIVHFKHQNAFRPIRRTLLSWIINNCVVFCCELATSDAKYVLDIDLYIIYCRLKSFTADIVFAAEATYRSATPHYTKSQSVLTELRSKLLSRHRGNPRGNVGFRSLAWCTIQWRI